jgi:hypothetical protein
MAIGTRKDCERQEDLWVAYTDMAAGPGHPFHVRLNEVLEGEGFDALVEKLCARFYAGSWGFLARRRGFTFARGTDLPIVSICRSLNGQKLREAQTDWKEGQGILCRPRREVREK